MGRPGEDFWVWDGLCERDVAAETEAQPGHSRQRPACRGGSYKAKSTFVVCTVW